MRGLCKISHPERRSQPKRGGGEGEDFEYTSHYIPPPSSIAVHGGKKSGGKNDCSSSSFSAAPRYSTTLSGRGEKLALKVRESSRLRRDATL